MKVYKGTDKDMKCRGMQYEIGKEYEAEGAVQCGCVGLHSCKAPFDVLKYYGLNKGNRYFEAEADGKIDEGKDGDSKIASSKLMIKAEIGLPGLIRAQMEYTRERAETGGKNGGRSNLAGGNYSNLAGGNDSLIVGRDGSRAKGGKNSVIVLTAWEWVGDEYRPTAVQAVIVDGDKIKADVWYTLKDGVIVEVEDDE